MSGWDTDEVWQEFRSEFIETVRQPCGWFKVWHLFVNNDLYCRQLSKCAKISLKETAAPLDWADDVASEAMLLMVRNLRKRRDLGYQLDRPPEQFARWLRTILFRQCREAIRTLRRRHGRDLPLNHDPVGQSAVAIEEELDVRAAIKKLEEPYRTVVSMKHNGLSLRQITDRVEMTYDKVCGAWKKGKAMLAQSLQSGYRID